MGGWGAETHPREFIGLMEDIPASVDMKKIQKMHHNCERRISEFSIKASTFEGKERVLVFFKARRRHLANRLNLGQSKLIRYQLHVTIDVQQRYTMEKLTAVWKMFGYTCG